MQNNLILANKISHKAGVHCIVCPLSGKCSEYVTTYAPCIQACACIYASLLFTNTKKINYKTGIGVISSAKQFAKDIAKATNFAQDCINTSFLMNEIDGGIGFIERAYELWEPFLKQAEKENKKLSKRKPKR